MASCVAKELFTNSIMQTVEKNYYPALTGIRAIAAWLVFVHHFNFFTPTVFGNHIHKFFAEMHIGVTIFFVLSGLLITLRYYDKNINSKKSFYHYMIKRFTRIYPVFFLILTANFIWSNIGFSNEWNWKNFIGSMFLLDGFFAGFSKNLISQSWSLTVEECFYILCPIVFLLLKKNIKWLFFLPVILITTGLLMTSFFIKHPFHGFFSDFRFLFNFTFLGRCVEFFVGIMVALLFKKGTFKKLNNYTYTFCGIVVIALSVFLLSLLSTGQYLGDHHPLGILINNLLLPVAGIAVLFWGLLTEQNIITKILASKPMVLFGKSSYVFYLIHVGFLTTFFAQNISGHPIVVFIFLNTMAVLLYKLVESPLHIWLNKKLIK